MGFFVLLGIILIVYGIYTSQKEKEEQRKENKRMQEKRMQEEKINIEKREQKARELIDIGNLSLEDMKDLLNNIYLMREMENCEEDELVKAQINQIEDYIQSVENSIKEENLDTLEELLTEDNIYKLQYNTNSVMELMLLTSIQKIAQKGKEKSDINENTKKEDIINVAEDKLSLFKELKDKMKELEELRNSARETVKCEIEYIRDYYAGTKYQEYGHSGSYKIGIKLHNTSLEQIQSYILILNLYSNDTVIQTVDLSKRAFLETNEIYREEDTVLCTNENLTVAKIKKFQPIFVKKNF